MPFPLPEPSALESNDVVRDEQKRALSPPSSFFAQSQALLTAVRYFENLHSGYENAARKHMNRFRSALFAQLMANFEFAVKDFLAQALDSTHIFDDEVKNWKWIEVDVATVLSTREGSGRIGAVLIHPLLGWQTPKNLNNRYRDVFGKPIVWEDEAEPLQDLWIIRHSVAHNGGFVTAPDARRLRSAPLADKQLLIDVAYLEETVVFLRAIVSRLSTEIGPVLLEKWFKHGAARDWTQDEDFYRRIKQMTLYVDSRIRDLPTVDEAVYNTDLAVY